MGIPGLGIRGGLRLEAERIFEGWRPLEAVVHVQVRRPDDLLVLDLRFENLRLRRGAGEARLVRTDAAKTGVLVVGLPPQSFGEEAWEVVGPGGTPEILPAPPSSRVRMAGPSRLAFTMPAGQEDLPYTLEAVLEAMRSWRPRLALGAQDDPEPRRGWLFGVLHSAVSELTRDRLTAGITSAAGAEDVPSVLDAAARRIAGRAAGALTAGGGERVAATVLRAMQPEIDRLQDRFPALREGPAHDATVASLALGVAQQLGSAAERLQLDDGVIAELPYLPLLLAPSEPSASTTALELPYRLLLSPIEDARWQHEHAPVAHGGLTELWHTRLRTAAGTTGEDGMAKVRALWSPDYPTDTAKLKQVSSSSSPKPFRMGLHAWDRQRLVKNMAGFGLLDKEGRRYTPRSAQARRLHLSSLGALLDVQGQWDPQPQDVDLQAWRHIAGLGRDAYVRVVYVGFLLPLRHDAALVKVTERKFETAPTGGRVAALRQRHFIVVRRPVVDYDPADHVHRSRDFPFVRVQMLTRVTPDLATPGADGTKSEFHDALLGEEAFWPMIPGPGGADPQDVYFEALATDVSGRQQCFSMPLAFVAQTPNQQQHELIRLTYNAAPPARRTTDVGGCTVCFTLPQAGGKGDPNLPTQSLTFRAGDPASVRNVKPNFFPEVDAAVVGIRPVQKLLGRPAAVSDVTYPAVWREGKANPGGVFLQMRKTPYKLEFGDNAAKSDAVGALAAPQMSIMGLSLVMGPVGGAIPAGQSGESGIAKALESAVANSFDPKQFFEGAKILGGVDLADILLPVLSLAGADVPKLLSRELPDRVEASFDWKTPITQPDPAKLILPSSGGPTELTMKGLVTTPLDDPGAATYEASARLTNFKVNLFGFIVIWFDDLQFTALKGQKPDVAVGLHPTDSVMFGGPLEFVNELKNLIPSNGFSDPPALSVTPSGIAASYSLTLPNIEVGIFALKNLSLGAGFNLPFDNKPAAVKFNFCERQHPFSLTVSMLGGGGFFALGISTRGVQEIEASLEFGAELSIDLGVASGGVEIKAGVYFHWLEKSATTPGSVELSGFVRLHGELSILGLISASLTFNLQLGYIKVGQQSQVFGEATLTIEVDVLFVSFDVSVSCRKEFDGGQGDPKFIALVPDEPTWEEYCGAFAEEAP